MRRAFECACVKCFREPLYLDFRSLGHHRALRKESIVPDVFRQLRLRTYRRIITELLKRSNNNIQLIKNADHDFLVLRRLLIANDLLLLHGGDYPGLASLHAPELTLEASLTSISLKDQDLLELIRNKQRYAAAYDVRIREVSQDPDHSQDLMALTLKFYLDKCNALNPTNLIVLDNLDQLPTQHIEELLRELHDLATQAHHLPLLVPLRPSSINPYGFVRDIRFRYHYGPNNFKMILSRLERYVLHQSRDELRIARGKTNDKPFPTAPQESEIDALLVVSYLYAKIMAAGLKKKSISRHTVIPHPDHQFLRGIGLGQGALYNLAETSDALVGACCRYGLDLLMRFFANASGNHEILDQAVKLRADYKERKRVRLGYADLVSNLLHDPVGGAQQSRVANLFEPTRVTSNWGWPTLAKLRILSLLSREKRHEVRVIIQHLGLLGIPADLTIDALNSLQDKFRLLIWLSTNRELLVSDPSSLSQDVVISEHGERYFRRVVGDFEYVWFCATALEGRRYSHDGLKFTVKLNDYKAMIQRLGTTEWKQIGFRRLRLGSLADPVGVGHATQMEVLNVLYSSLGRAMLGAGVALRVYTETRRLSGELIPLLNEICAQILFWQRRYEMAYGSNFYLSVYHEQIADLQHDLLRLTGDDFPGLEQVKESLRQVHSSWLKKESTLSAINIAQLAEVPEDDLVALVERSGRGVFPGFRDWVAAVDKHARVNVFLAHFVKLREKLATLLETRLPNYSEISRPLSSLLDDMKKVVSGAQEVPASGDVMLRWCIDDQAALQEISDIINANQYDVPELCGMEQMTALKVRCTNIIDATERLARHVGVLDTEHLSARWQ